MSATPQFAAIAALSALLLLTGCDRADKQPGPATDQSSATDDASPAAVLAYVDGTPITEQELDFAKVRIFGGVDGRVALAGAEDKLLESLVASRALALRAESSLTAEEKRELDYKVAGYREELLVKHYLTSHVTASPVTSEMVSNYYNDHPEEFGGDTEKTFEYVTTVGDLASEDRHRWIRALGTLANEGDWQAWVAAQQDPAIVFRQAKTRAGILDEPLRSLVQGTAKGTTSGLHNGSQLMIVRVTDAVTVAPRPLTEVSAEIRRKLAPVQLRKAVKALSEAAIKESKVVFVRNTPDGQQAAN